MQLEYRIYYQDEEITTVTTQTAEGEYIVVDPKTWLDVQNSPSRWKVVDKTLERKFVDRTKGKKKKKFTVKGHNTFPGWVIIKFQLYTAIEYAIEEPEWFDPEKHAVVGYEEDD